MIRKRFKKERGRSVNLETPVLFCDKLQWLKLNWRDSLGTICSDKYSVRNFVKERIGDHYLNEVYEVYDNVSEINIDNLPESFVLKGTHGSGYNLICKDKSNMDWDKAFKEMRRWLKNNYFWKNREWVYKDIEPKIICEKFLREKDKEALVDYKFYCFNGVVKYCQVIRGRQTEETIDFYDVNWSIMPFTGLRNLPNSNESFQKPSKYNEMIELAQNLAKNFPFVRVDFYYVNERIIFGEMTFFPTSGYGSFYPSEWNKKIGDLLKLPRSRNQ
ncbi:ATP-grasp fold amidoligase family protein [Shouchella sp. JSM 1781072]|uniref:ATP-grasp fold amidoligase family protein n=1 Tax=Shouchella sp. JSM 1781072 TaxID=3344581 RepID=UPI0035C22E77